ncbi:MAG: SAM-dependent methyltransferase, partial [Bacteroidetes bacterium]|nr:SAM-dependent methyltransferase [Bacteroidota bacterium]
MSSKSETNNNGKLYLIPTLLGESTSDIISETTKEILNKTEIYIVENAKSARHFLKEMGLQPKLPYLTMHELNKRTDPLDMLSFLDASDESK